MPMMNTGDGGTRLTPPDGGPGWQDLGRTYLKIGAIGFGGGYAVINLVHSELVEKHRWLTEQSFQNMVALSEMAPGALSVNLLAGIAYRLGGVKAMVLATTALILPSFVLIIILAGLFFAWQNNPVVKGALQGLTAGVVGLLLAVVWDLVKKAPRHWCYFVIGGAALVLGFAFPLNPIWLVLTGGLAGALKVAVEAFSHKRANSTSDGNGAG
jgi:chromate transporter